MPISSITDARDEIISHFSTAWAAQPPPVPALFYTDVTQELPDEDTWASIRVQHDDSDSATVGGETGNRRFRRIGTVTVEIRALADNEGLSTADALAKVALDAFEGQKTAEDRIHFRNSRIQEVGHDGPWFQINVVSGFEYDEVK